jgi:hypothetical protein
MANAKQYSGTMIEDLMADPFLKGLIPRVLGMTFQKRCEYEHTESTYGAGDALPCGKDAQGFDEEGRWLCQNHITK